MLNKRLIIHSVLILLLLLNLAFIFVQSALPREESKETSDKVGEIVGEIIPPETKPGEFVQINLRKIAHFVEFFTLGILSSIYVVFLGAGARRATLSLCFAPSVALFDETIQIFSGRASSVKDVWIDSAGFFTAALIFYTVYYLTVLLIRKCKQK